MNPPTVLAPACLADLERLAPLAARAADVRFVGGGTLEVPRWHAEGAPRFGIYLPGIRELTLRRANVCGAATTMDQIANDPCLPPLLRDTAAACATPAVRAVATLGGNLAACRPGCLAVALLALEATVTLFRPGGGTRRVPVAEALPRGTSEVGGHPELIVRAGWAAHPERSAVRRATLQSGCGQVVATVAVAAGRHGGRLRWHVAAGGTGVLPQRLATAERLLDGGRADAPEVSAAAATDLAVRPSAALAGEERYLRHLVGVLVDRAASGAADGRPR